MKSSVLSHLHPLIKLIIIFAIAFVLVNIVYPIALVIGAPFFGIRMGDALNTLMENGNLGGIDFLKYQQAVTSITLFMLTSVIAAFLFSDSIPRYLYLKKSAGIISPALGVFALLAGIPFLAYMAKLNSLIPVPEFMKGLEAETEQVDKMMQRVMDMKTPFDYIANLLVVGVIAAVSEELFFRGIIQKLLGEWTRNVHIGVILTALIFSIMHFQISGIITRFVLGLFLGYLLVWSGSLWLPVLVHFFNNSFIVTVVYFFHYDFDSAPLETFSWWMALVSITLSLSILYVLKKYEKIRPVRLGF